MQIPEIKLLHLLKTLTIGGIEKTTVLYSNELSDILQSVNIFGGKGIYSHENLISQKVKLFQDIKGKIGLNRFFISNLVYLIRVVKQQQINVIFYHFRIFLPFILILKILFPDIKIVYIAHSYFNDALNYLIYADLYIAVSDLTKKDLLKYGKSDIIVIKHGVKIAEGVDNHKNSGMKNFGFIGRFDNHKGIDVLLNAFKELHKEYEFINLIFRGEGKLKDDIIHFSIKHNLTEQIIVEDPVLDEQILFKDIDALVFPSKSLEGFGVVILEAINFNIPVIASDIIKEISLIKNFETGLLFKNGDFRSLEAKLKILINNQTLKGKLTDNASNLIKQEYNINFVISAYQDIFLNL